jgi:RimJ/RimL family protein N-acetyltransferase
MEQSLRKKASDAKYSLKDDPTYEDALKVFNRLDFDDRANIAPRHPDFLREVPDDMLFDRQVAIDGDGNPVGFNEFYYGRDKLGRRQPPHNAIAVVPEARGNGLSRLMVEAAVRKARKEKIRRLVWEAFADNKGSIRAALSAGFEDATPKNAKGYRRFVYRVSEKKS